jgi:hypothetical protein
MEVDMIARLQLFISLVLIGCLGLLTGCGGGSSASTTAGDLSGRASQAPIINGTVFADRVVGGVSNFLQDADEVAASTDANGNYRLPTPAYDYILVSKGGTDKVSGLKQILLLAPKGSANITPLTTLVTLDTSGRLAQKLQALQGGARFDSDVYTNSSPAVLMLIKSVEISVQSLTDTFLQKSGGTITTTQICSIQARTMQKIAETLVNSTLDLAVPANLNSLLITAIKSAIPAITAENGNIVIPPADVAGIAASVANIAVDVAAQALNRSGHADPSPLGTVAGAVTAESSLLSFAASFTAAQGLVVSTLSAPAFTITASATPLVYNAPTIPVQTGSAAVITGSGGSSGGLGF